MDNIICHLPWTTDLDAARATARVKRRPILSLRLLGRLDEELSCANSRFFRTTLYPAQTVSHLLATRFVLHWESVRPVPRVTVDFGDGRRLETTLTGNSAHLVLDPHGRPVNALPGLYDATTFTRALSAAADLAVLSAPLTGSAREARIAAWHHSRMEALSRTWQAELTRAGMSARIKPERAPDAVWRRLADLHAPGALPDPGVRAALSPNDARSAGALAVTKMAIERPFLDALLPLARNIAEDTARNEHTLHRRVHATFAQADVGSDPRTFTDWIYRTLFLMPPEDPWFGLEGAQLAS